MRAAGCVYVDAYTHLYIIHIQRYEFYKYVNQGTDPSPHCFFLVGGENIWYLLCIFLSTIQRFGDKLLCSHHYAFYVT